MVLTGVYYLKISLIPPFLLKCLCQGQEYERSCTCICGLGVSILPLSTILFCNCLDRMVCCIFRFISAIFQLYRDCQKITEEDSLNRYIELIVDIVGLG